MINPNIYVSYSWKTESKAVVDEIQAALRTQQIEIQRDINVLTYKGKITEFMQLIGKGKIIILVIGKDYLESENCMYELMQIASQGDIYERIVPIYLPSADIHKIILRAKYVKVWTEQYKEIENLDPTTLVNIPQEDVHLYRTISQEIGKLMQFLATINALSLEMHQESNWKELIHTIKSMRQNLGTVEKNIDNTNKNNSIIDAESFRDLCKLIDPFLDDNYNVFSNFGPNSGADIEEPMRQDMSLWYEARKEIILPNNKMILQLLEHNKMLIPKKHLQVIQKFKNHVFAFEKHCLNPFFDYSQHLFPKEFTFIIKNELK